MNIRSLTTLIFVLSGATALGTGCSSSSTSGTGGSTGAGGAGGGTGGAGTGGVTGTGGSTVTDASADSPDAAAPTFTDVFTIISNTTTPTADTSPGCANCHDGVIPDGGMAVLPHVMNFKDKAMAYAMLVGVNSIRCGAVDGGTALKRVAAGSPDTSVLVQKLRLGRGVGTACDNVGMPLNPLVPADGGSDAAGTDAGFVPRSHYAISADELQTIESWVTAGALNN